MESDTPVGHDADAGRRDEHSVSLAAIDDLGIAGDERHACFGTRLPHRAGDALQVRERQPLFEDERRGQIKRRRAADGEVVDRAMDRQLADVAAGEKERGAPQRNRW